MAHQLGGFYEHYLDDASTKEHFYDFLYDRQQARVMNSDAPAQHFYNSQHLPWS